MKTFTTISAFVLALAASSAFASECDADIAKVDAQFISTNPLPMDTLAEAKKLRDEAFAYCQAGDTQQGLALLAQGKQLLGIE